MPIKAVFFDLGETLIDERRMWREWADYLGVTETEFLAALDDAIARGEHHHRAFESSGRVSTREQRAHGSPMERAIRFGRMIFIPMRPNV